MNTSQVSPLKPGQIHWIGFHTLHLDELNIIPLLLNFFLEDIGSQKRAYIILHEDAPRASGVWTIEQAETVANRLSFGADGNFHDPKQRSWLLRPFQYLGWIS